MEKLFDFEIFPDFIEITRSDENNIFEESNIDAVNKVVNRINISLDDWHKVQILDKVDIIKSTDTQVYIIRHYKIRYRLYYADVMKMLGLNSSDTIGFYGYWEKDEDGNFLGYHSIV